ncbi:MAG TPA: AAA family ATPase [Thermoanaerobaculia bacterium]|nr:AAA family ATPase [Thermoanaerobaculia bacterium]
MLKLDLLELSGFKSFVDPVRVRFAGGITAIVGPNGCGKSNLSDAMTWVLGEQSAKSLRGGTMEDVIFNGAEQRKPLGMAEVTLELKTHPGAAGSEDGRIALGRRVFRGGESQYRLNGRTVRLKDVRDLLMDTGLGIRAYSVIEQGKIGLILSGKPQERRKLLEEAAGITRYKVRKGLAEVKLEEATANLVRLDDIIAEVERALRSLKRQAGAARRYQQAEGEYRGLLELVLTGRWDALAARLAAVRGQIDEAGAREAELAAALHRDEAALAAGRERLDSIAREVAARHLRQADLAARIEGGQQFVKANCQTGQEIAERAAQAQALAARRREELARLDEALAELGVVRSDLAAERDTAAAAVDADLAEIAAADSGLGEAQARLEARRADLLARTAETNGLRGRLQQTQLELDRGDFRRNHLEQELGRQGQELATATEALAAARERMAALEADLAERAAALDGVTAALDAAMRREAEATVARRELEERLSAARQRQAILGELSRAHAERRAVLEEALRAAGIEAPDYLASRARAVAGWERGLDFYLGALADAVVLAPGASALDLARALAGRAGAILIESRAIPDGDGPGGAPPPGSSSQAPATPLASTADPARSEAQAGASDPAVAIAPAGTRWGSPPGPLLDDSADDPAVLLSLGQALGLPEELAAVLPPAYLVEDPADAERLARAHPGAAFLSRHGLWVAGGTFHVEGEVVTPGVLERRRELEGLDREVPDLAARLAAAAARLEELVAARAALAGESNRLQSAVAQLRQELAVASARHEDAAHRHRRLANETETLGTEREEVGRELARTEARREGLARDLAEAERALASADERLSAAQAEVEAAKGGRESLRADSAGRKGRLEVLSERLAAQDREAARLAAELDEGRRQVAAWDEEAARLTARRAQLDGEIERAERELQEALELRAAAEEGVLAEQARLDAERQAVQLLEERIAEERERREGVRHEVEELRVDRARLEQDAEHLRLTFHEEFARELPAVEEASAGGGPAAPELAEREAELARCKATLERLGPVNALAVEEHDEQEQRLEFLTAQRADVANSVESLRATIREINQASSERFLATFVEVNRHFGAVFSQLFRGGEAEMRLMDEEDVLECGLEIVARPPGKRLQNLMLLSGGEKALTAIALLFALFRTKPSPFCILDEVDAPLDDLNTRRFVELLKEMSAETQFLVITHNKITMEVASTLYGVTMEEKGVSKLVAVQLEELQPEAERATA